MLFIRRNLPLYVAALVVCLTAELLFPLGALALTGGPSQPEVESFEPVDTTELVDPFTGDFTYNIPLLDVGGYPINLSYHAGVSMDQEASWVGLGWNINPGVINRTMRGLPDDFDGDVVKKEFSVKPNETIGVTASPTVEVSGLGLTRGQDMSLGIKYNNYRGLGADISAALRISASHPAIGSLSVGRGISGSSQDGADIWACAEVRVLASQKRGLTLGGKIGQSFNSRGGLSTYSSVSAGVGGISAEYGAIKNSNGNQSYSLSVTRSLTRQIGNVKITGGLSQTMKFNTANPGFTPTSLFSNEVKSRTYRLAVGGEMAPLYLGWGYDGYHTRIKQTSETADLRAFGLMNLQRADENSLMDFNREKDGPWLPEKPNLSLPQLTSDLYMVTGQGIGGQYQLFRSDVGLVSDPISSSKGDDGSGGFEVGVAPNLFHAGVDVMVNEVNTENGVWNSGNDMLDRLRYRDLSQSEPSRPDLETSYFKAAGEATVLPQWEENFWEGYGGERAARVSLSQNREAQGSWVVAGNAGTINTPARNYKRSESGPSRSPRSQMISTLTAAEAARFGLQRQIEYYLWNATTGEYEPETLMTMDRHSATGPRKTHHISEITVTHPDGTRYVYGIPVYNSKQIDASFNASEKGRDTDKGLVFYYLDDNDRPNAGGIDKMRSRTELPGYAYAYLLTAILSPDYQDVSADGPTDDDRGTYTRFDYGQIHGGANPYKWRAPYPVDEQPVAAFSEMVRADNQDDVGSYVYGEKEIWYLHSVSTKTHVARFHVSPRQDGVGVAGEHAGKNAGSPRLCKLDSIILYSKPQAYTIPQLELEKATKDLLPIKGVYFRYSYSLCGNVYNNVDYVNEVNPASMHESRKRRGKLTLEQVFFGSGNYRNRDRDVASIADSEPLPVVGALNSYRFGYSGHDEHNELDPEDDPGINPDYHPEGHDRWGVYRPSEDNGLRSDEFPYTRQDAQVDDSPGPHERASAWSLRSVYLPTGGRIRVEYESDDYATVQDKDAMQMFQVVGVGVNPTGVVEPETTSVSELQHRLYESESGGTIRQCVYFRLHEEHRNMQPGTPAAAAAFLKEKYFDEKTFGQQDEYVYFKFRLDVGKHGSDDVFGYFKLDLTPWQVDGSPSYGMVRLVESGQPMTFGWLTVALEPLNDNTGSGWAHPISKAGWNFGRLNAPHQMYDGQRNFDNPDPIAIIRTIGMAFASLGELLKRSNKIFWDKEFSSEFKPERSHIRLRNPVGRKYGGGLRVSEIALADNWNAMSNSAAASTEYGQKYEYTLDNSARSSGVATYEPLLGGDENALKQYIEYRDSKRLSPDDEHYQETPMGENFFPAPSVGYSTVRVRPFTREVTDPESPGERRFADGYEKHEFYTARDFPTIVELTDRAYQPYKSGVKIADNAGEFLEALLGLKPIETKDHLAASQGYSVILNDMHGKPKMHSVYAGRGKNERLVSAVQHDYRQTEDGGPLNSEVPVVFPDDLAADKLNVRSRVIGRDIEMVSDMRRSYSKTVSSGGKGNVDVLFIGLSIAVFGSYLGSSMEQEVETRLASTSKVVRKYGVLERVTATSEGSQIKTENLLWDGQTGQVLLTRTQNEFDDWVYSFTVPAHWAYPGMGLACFNQGIRFEGDVLDAGVIKTALKPYFFPGDEVRWSVKDASNNSDLPQRAWVIEDGSGGLRLVNEIGSPVSSQASDVLIYRSGRRNQAMTSIGTIVTLKDPRETNNTVLNLDFTQVLNAEATEFSDRWKIRCCGFGERCSRVCETTNPFFTGLRGNWRPRAQHLYQTDRTTPAGRSKTRSGGVYASFDPFWQPGTGGAPWTASGLENPRWAKGSEATLRHDNGMEMESRDALGNYSAAIYGYAHNLPVATASNARYREIAYDGMEDYEWTPSVASVTGSTVFCRIPNQLDFSDISVENPINMEQMIQRVPLAWSNGSATALAEDVAVSNMVSHTGMRSLRLDNGATHYAIRQTATCADEEMSGETPILEHELGECSDCIPLFKPDKDTDSDPENNVDANGVRSRTYRVSVWTRVQHGEEELPLPPVDPDDGAWIEVLALTDCDKVPIGARFYPAGPAVDGWRRIEGSFIIPNEVEVESVAKQVIGLMFELGADQTRQTYFDDFRAHPFHSTMKSYVYHPLTLRLMAELDENNFATFYEYDEAGALARVKRETERGIITLKETRGHLSKLGRPSN